MGMVGPASLSFGQLAELRRVGSFMAQEVQVFRIVLTDHGVFLWIESFCPEIVPNRRAGAASNGPWARAKNRAWWDGELRYGGRPAGHPGLSADEH